MKRLLPFLLIATAMGADGRVVRSSSATEANDDALHWRTFDLSGFQGDRARIRVNDNSSWSAIVASQFSLSDEAKAVPVDATRLFSESHRPQFHYAPRAYWMSDPNGLLYHEGRWHLFHQHRYPGSGGAHVAEKTGGFHPGMVWAHAVSDDLLHWKHKPVAFPAEAGCSVYSGSGVVDKGNASGLQQGSQSPVLLFYSLRPPGPNVVTEKSILRMTQNLAYSTDGGETFTNYEGNPILRTPDYRDRDPKVFFHKPSGAWIMVLSLSANNTREQATYGIFRSQDLHSWKLVQQLGPNPWFWECPDLFELPVDSDPGSTKWLLVKGSGDYIVGSFDGYRFVPETDRVRTRWGSYYYATQTFSNVPGGRRVQLAWMNTGKPDQPNSYPGMPFNQQMSFPRELTLRTTSEGPRLFRYPVREIEQLYRKTHRWQDRVLRPNENPLDGITHDLLDIDLEVELRDAESVRLTLRGEEIVYERTKQRIEAFGTAVPLAQNNASIRIRALMDRASIEVFGNRGEVDVSKIFYPDPSRRDISISVSGGPAHIVNLAVHELRSVWQ